MQVYETALVNDNKRRVSVYERDGSVFIELEPGQTYEATSRNPETMYARWSEVKWKADGSVSLITRTNWREPERGRWVLKMLNLAGAPVEFRYIGGETVMVPDEDPLKGVTIGNVKQKEMKADVVGGQRICLPRGIPVLASCPLLDPLVRFSELTIKKVEIKTKDKKWEGFLQSQWILRDEKVPRADSELKALAKIIDELK